MLASGTSCELTCDAGYVLAGEQPSCLAGVVSASIECRNADGSVDTDEVDATGGSVSLYAPDTTPTVGAPATRPARQPHPTAPPAPAHPVEEAAVEVAVEEAEVSASGSASERSMMIYALAACGIVFVLGALKLICGSSQPQISPADAAAAAKVSTVTPGPMPADFGKVETNDNALFGGMVFETQ